MTNQANIGFTAAYESWWLQNHMMVPGGKGQYTQAHRPPNFPVGGKWNNWQTRLVGTCELFHRDYTSGKYLMVATLHRTSGSLNTNFCFSPSTINQQFHYAVNSFPMTGKYGNQTLVVYLRVRVSSGNSVPEQKDTYVYRAVTPSRETSLSIDWFFYQSKITG